jgi:signal peptidase
MTDRPGDDAADEPPDRDEDPFEYPAEGSHDTAPGSERPSGIAGRLRHFWTTDSAPLVYLRDALTSVLIVIAIGLLLFAASGVWPPMVAVISDSMEPNMQRGDLVFIMDNERFAPEGAVVADGGTTGIVPAERAERRGRTSFGGYGDVIVFHRNGNDGGTPIIHRAMFWVDAGENWYDRADPSAVGGAENCEALEHCPAPHGGFITKGDNEVTNPTYDQVSRLSAPVRPGWIVGTAELRVPYLGHVRLLFSSVTVPPVDVGAAGASEPAPATQPSGTEAAGNATATAAAAAFAPAPASLRPA